jgi:hypothetical protein
MILKNLLKTALCTIILLISSHCFATDKDILDLVNRNNNAITKFCSGKPKTLIIVFEGLSRSLQVNPDSINLNRVSTFKDQDMGIGEIYFKCMGVFYSPKGAQNCEIDFDEKGVISKACGVGRNDTYTERLRQEFLTTQMFKPADPNKQWGIGDRYSRKPGDKSGD